MRTAHTAKLPAKVARWQWLIRDGFSRDRPPASCVLRARTKLGSADTLSECKLTVGGRDETSYRTRAAPRGRRLRLAATATGRDCTSASARCSASAGLDSTTTAGDEDILRRA